MPRLTSQQLLDQLFALLQECSRSANRVLELVARPATLGPCRSEKRPAATPLPQT